MNFHSLFRALLVTVLLCGTASAQKAYFPIMQDRPMEYPLQTAFCGEVQQPPVIDGRLDDACWQDIEPLEKFQLTNGTLEKSRQVPAPGRFARH